MELDLDSNKYINDKKEAERQKRDLENAKRLKAETEKDKKT